MKVFISYAREDYEVARKLYNDLKKAEIDPWLDSENILPGQNWKMVIRRAIKESSYFLALLSSNSMKGYVQKEIKIALDILDEIPEGELFIIPIHLDNCEPLDERLQNIHRVDLYYSYKSGLKDILKLIGSKSKHREGPEKTFLRKAWDFFSQKTDIEKVSPQEKRVFISYENEDWETAVMLYNDLKSAGASPWAHHIDLLPGLNRKKVIREVIRNCRYFLKLLSSNSLSIRGDATKEMKIALDITDEFPHSEIFIIPIRIDDCAPIDESLKALYMVDLFPSYENGVKKILRVIVPEYKYKKDSVFRKNLNYIFQKSIPDKKPISETNYPKGFILKHTFRGHIYNVNRIAWSQDGKMLASPSNDKTIRLWDTESGKLIHTLNKQSDSINAVSWSPNSNILASCSDDNTIKIWDARKGESIKVLEKHTAPVQTVAWSPDAQLIASGSKDQTVRFWDAETGKSVTRIDHNAEQVCLSWSPDTRTLAMSIENNIIELWDIETKKTKILEGHSDSIYCLAWSPDGKTLVSGAKDSSIRLWNTLTGKQKAILDGHTGPVCCVSFSWDGRVLASKSKDNTVRIWRMDTYETVAQLEEQASDFWTSGLAFHPSKPVLATLDEKDTDIRIWELDTEKLLPPVPVDKSAFYTNAKVVLVGETSTGKTCLARALMEKPFEPQESTHGMKIWTYQSETATQDDGTLIARETFLWDLAGQSDYQLIHQLFLDETSLGIVLFDPTRQDDPFGGVGHWEKSLQRVSGKDCPRLLVAGRVDCGRPTVTPDDIKDFCKDYDFLDFFSTSAKTGKGVHQLRSTISCTIPWDNLPVTSSPVLWRKMREYLHERRMSTDVLTQRRDLFQSFRDRNEKEGFQDAEFETVIGHAQAQGLVWRLSFGDFILMKPELLNDYASAIIHAARDHPEGLGCVTERDVLDAKIDLKNVQRLNDPATEQSLLHAVVELLIDREIAIREGEYLVFPSKFNRKRPEYPKPPLREVAYRFEGPVEDIYATLVVRLFYCGAFDKKDFWKNAAEFFDPSDQNCGFVLDEPEEGKGLISVFFEDNTSMKSKVLFLRFIHDHLKTRSIDGTLKRERIYRCPNPGCREEVVDRRGVEIWLKRGKKNIICNYCDEQIILMDLMEEKFGDPDLLNQVRLLEKGAEQKKENEVNITTAMAKHAISEFDVFLAHNSIDKPLVEAVGMELKRRGLNPWFDKWNLPPGRMFQKEIEDVLPSIKAVAVFVGPGGIGPWEDMEIRVAIDQFVKRSSPVIPVLLPGLKDEPELPLFLDGFVWVSFQENINETEVLDNLEWGITGKNPKTGR